MPLNYLEDEDRLMPLDDEDADLPRLKSAPTSVSPEMRRILVNAGGVRPPGDSYEVAEAARKNADLVRVVGERPEAPNPKWWQKLAAAAVGGAAGYANAEGRTRHQIDAGPAADAILMGGYGKKISDWNDKVQGAKVASDAANANRDAWWKNRKMQSDEDLAQAQAEQARQRGEYYQHRSELEQNQWKVNSKGQLYNTVTGEIKNPAPTSQERFDEAKDLGFDDEQARFYALNGKIPETKTEKPRNLVNVAPGHTVYDPETGKPVFSAPDRPDKTGGGGPRPLTQNQKVNIETRKNKRLADAEDQARKLSTDDPSAKAQIYEDLERVKQQIQDDYEQEIGVATGADPGHFEYPEQKPKPKPETPKSTGGRGPKPEAAQPAYPKTEADARQRAIAAGKDPDLYVQALRAKGILK